MFPGTGADAAFPGSPRTPRGFGTSFDTMTEEELSESLVYLTCPICEQVFSKEPVFTPCHHTFCSTCIHDRLEGGEKTCAECRRPLAADQLQPNVMAINLLNTMKSGCIYRANGCRWKGLVRDLAAHHAECKFAVTGCPYGCGARVDRTSMRAHQRTCEWRFVSDCVCRQTFRSKDREAHEQSCLPFLQQRLPQVLSERDGAFEALRALTGQLHELRRDGAEKRVEAASATASALLLSLALLSIIGQIVRPDASLAVALALLLSVTARNSRGIGTLGWLLPLASLLADAAWLLFLGPRLPAFAGLLPDSLARSLDPYEEAYDEPTARDQLALAYVAAVATVKILIMLPYAPLQAALSESHVLSPDEAAAAAAATAADAAAAAAAADGPVTTIRSGRGGGGGGLDEDGRDGVLQSVAATAALAAALSRQPDSASPSSSNGRANGRSGDGSGLDDGGGGSVHGMPPLAAAPQPMSWGTWLLDVLGVTLLIVSMFSSVTRPDAGAALALLVLCALRESRLYFSRVLLGASFLAIGIDLAYLHLQALPQLAWADLASTLVSPSQLHPLLTDLSTQARLAVWATLISLPLKALLMLAAVHLSCLPHVAEHRPFRWAPLQLGPRADDHPDGSGSLSACAASACAVGGLGTSSSCTSIVPSNSSSVPASVPASARATAADPLESGRGGCAASTRSHGGGGSAHLAGGGGVEGTASRAEQRRVTALIREAESAQAAQLEQAKRGYTMCFLAMLLAISLACMRALGDGVDLGSPEAYVFAMLCCYACLRHSLLCESRPERCRAVLGHAALLVAALAAVDTCRLLIDDDARSWSTLSLLGRLSLAMRMSILLLLVLLLFTLLRLSTLLASMLQRLDGVSESRLLRYTNRTRLLAAVGFVLSLLASCVRRDADAPAFALVLFATTATAETDATAALAAIAHAHTSPRFSHLASWGVQVGLDPYASRHKQEARARKSLFCLAPDVHREAGGLLTATLLLALTSAADAYWGLLAIADFTLDPAPAVPASAVPSSAPSAAVPPTVAAASAASAMAAASDASIAGSVGRLLVDAPAGGIGSFGSPWANLGAGVIMHLRAHLEIAVMLAKLVCKGSLALTAARLMLLPKRKRPPPDGVGAFGGTNAGDTDVAPQFSSLLYTTCALLLLLVTLSCSLLPLLTYPSQPAAAAALDTATPEFIHASAEAFDSLALGLAFGPSATLATLGCALALGSGNQKLARLLAVAVFAAALADCAWLALGPLQFSTADLADLAEGQSPPRWASLPPELLVTAVALLLETPFKLGIAMGSFFRF